MGLTNRFWSSSDGNFLWGVDTTIAQLVGDVFPPLRSTIPSEACKEICWGRHSAILVFFLCQHRHTVSSHHPMVIFQWGHKHPAHGRTWLVRSLLMVGMHQHLFLRVQHGDLILGS